MKRRNNLGIMMFQYIIIVITIFLGTQLISTVLSDIISIEREIVPLSINGEETSKEEYSIYLNTLFSSNDKASIDYSNTADGYISVIYTEETDKRIKVRVQGPETLYTYDLKQGEWATFPLTDGNGEYTVTVYKNSIGTSYYNVLKKSFEVELADEVSPYLISNQYVNFEMGEETIKKAAELTENLETDIEKFQAIYNFVVTNFTYDYAKVKTLQPGYIPDLDKVLGEEQGICFDYAALIAGMLRSQNIPCKLVIGYVDNAYHAWISVYVECPDEEAIYYDDAHWLNLDPTWASARYQQNHSSVLGGSSSSTIQPTYVEKYSY